MISSRGKKYCAAACLTAASGMAFWCGCRLINIWRLRYQAQKEYEKFLWRIESPHEGDSAGDGEDAIFDDEEVCGLMERLAPGDDVQYLYCDVDNDGILELHIRFANKFYYILKYDKGFIYVMYSGSAYQQPVDAGGLCGVLYDRRGGAPDNETYCFTAFGPNGQETGPEYQWYDANENKVKDEDDIYFRDDAKQSMDEWMRETEKHREWAGQEAGWVTLKDRERERRWN